MSTTASDRHKVVTFEMVFTHLKQVLSKHVSGMDVVVDSEQEFFINTSFIMKNKKPLYFGSVKINKHYVSYHLMPVYVSPDLLNGMSESLKKRMQGKSCFNFKTIDEHLFNELDALTQQGRAFYEGEGYLIRG